MNIDTVAVAMLLAVLAGAAAACAQPGVTPAEAQRMLEASPRFSAPNVLRVRPSYCSTIEAPSGDGSSGLGRLEGLVSAGAIRIEHRAAAPGECTSIPGPMRERLEITLTEVGAGFHPRTLEDGAGWEFTLGRRHVVSVGDITYNRSDEPTLARVGYRWAWRADLLGQLLQLSEEPVNAQATFTRPDGEWTLRDPGF